MADFDNLFDAAIARADETIRGYMGTSATITSGEQSARSEINNNFRRSFATLPEFFFLKKSMNPIIIIPLVFLK